MNTVYFVGSGLYCIEFVRKLKYPFVETLLYR